MVRPDLRKKWMLRTEDIFGCRVLVCGGIFCAIDLSMGVLWGVLAGWLMGGRYRLDICGWAAE